MDKRISPEQKIAELTMAYDAVVGLLHSPYLSDDTRRKANSLLSELAAEISQLQATKGSSNAA